ncbi:hypothetical protein [Geobacter pickeringii]|uniref:Uncharacterized protein n=1 Tax=Geobacter pickeringii TaxID=345632 RepID=A0A0B5B9H2_9BACT|nr:hypothetical protein [Geobacter pickeringii]AJE03212.1 hypothetical protein GPICK_07435 [Geobacter pickeringii]
MDCIALKKFIATDSHLSQIHFLLKTKAKRGESHALVYNAGRFFDRHEDNCHRELVFLRGSSFEAALRSGLIRLGLAILAAGFGIVVRNLIAVVAIPLVVFLLRGQATMIRRAYLYDRCLKDYLTSLRQTRPHRREAFLKEVSEREPCIADCDRT